MSEALIVLTVVGALGIGDWLAVRHWHRLSCLTARWHAYREWKYEQRLSPSERVR